jgi:hypothetical protein
MGLDNYHENISYYITKSVVTKYVVLPPGVVVELNRGQPSGHPFGTLINCNVNLIYWSLIGFRIYGKNYGDKMRVEVYGDDTYAYFMDHPNLMRIDEYIKEIGLKSDTLVPNFRRIGKEYRKDHQIDFLKRRFDESGIIWNHKKMIDRIIYPSRNRNLEEQIELLMGYVNTCGNDPDLIKVTNKTIDIIKIKYKKSLVNFGQYNRDIIKAGDICNLPSVKHSIEKSSSYFRGKNALSSFRKYAQIYGWSVIRMLETDSIIEVAKRVNFKYSELLFLIGFNISEYKRRDKQIKLLGGRDPPKISERSKLLRIKTYVEFIKTRIENKFRIKTSYMNTIGR